MGQDQRSSTRFKLHPGQWVPAQHFHYADTFRYREGSHICDPHNYPGQASLLTSLRIETFRSTATTHASCRVRK